MDINTAYPGQYLKAADLQGRSVTVTIERIELESVGQGAQAESKPVVYFAGKERGLVLNKTNAMMLAAFMGPETDNWIGQKVTIRPEMVSFQGRPVQALRVHPPANPTPAPRPPQARTAPPPPEQAPLPVLGEYEYDDSEFVASDEPPF